MSPPCQRPSVRTQCVGSPSVRTQCVESPMHALSMSLMSCEVGYDHNSVLRKLMLKEGTTLGHGQGVCGSPSHPALPIRMSAAGMSEDETAQPPRTSLWDQDRQVRGCPAHGAGAQGEGGRSSWDSVRPGTPSHAYPCWTLCVCVRGWMAHLTHFPDGRRDARGGEHVCSHTRSPPPPRGPCLSPSLCPPSGHSQQQMHK